MPTDCIHLGQATLARRPCIDGCGGSPKGTPSRTKLVVFNCNLPEIGSCTVEKHAQDTQCCRDCRSYEPIHAPAGGQRSLLRAAPATPAALSTSSSLPKSLLWSYGVTTVPSRRENLLPQTLETLKTAGFDRPRLFVDGTKDGSMYEQYFGLEVTTRFPAIQVFKSWALALVELYLREPEADRYALFQDDIIACRGLRTYLEAWYPDRGYQNLFTFGASKEFGPDRAKGNGWRMSDQKGLGALGLVFSREAILTLFMSQHFVERPITTKPEDAKTNWRKVDGGVVDSMRKAGWSEYIHSPSLLQHCGIASTVVNRNRSPDWVATSFRGKDWDAMEMLNGKG